MGLQTRNVLLALLVLFLAAACEKGDKPSGRDGYEILVGDTLITIPAEAVEFAGTAAAPNHFSWHAYMLREFQVASNPNIPREGSHYTGSLLEWKTQPWVVRQTFLVTPYVHDVTTATPELYYYMIGTYREQFGYGWVDTFDAEADLWDPSARPWLHPADSTLAPDNQGTLSFDGGLGDMLEYRAMWGMD
ncbi:MAG: hypothetical protein H6508_00870 [Calditrichaeota bacterium]|nr:hypothetical protein [Calditrichota bacterium]MCB9365727.1 hypothetical protein [Calditrichota bacterium]